MKIRSAVGGLAASIVAVLAVAGAVPILHSEAVAHRTAPGASQRPVRSGSTPGEHVVVALLWIAAAVAVFATLSVAQYRRTA